MGNNVGLLMTDKDPKVFQSYCKQAVHVDYARAGAIATESVTIPVGTVSRNEEFLSHTFESQLRNAGMPVLLKGGFLILDAPYTICQQGDVLTSDQAKLLKVFFYQLSEFRINPIAVLHDGAVSELSPDHSMDV